MLPQYNANIRTTIFLALCYVGGSMARREVIKACGYMICELLDIFQIHIDCYSLTHFDYNN